MTDSENLCQARRGVKIRSLVPVATSSHHDTSVERWQHLGTSAASWRRWMLGFATLLALRICPLAIFLGHLWARFVHSAVASPASNSSCCVWLCWGLRLVRMQPPQSFPDWQLERHRIQNQTARTYSKRLNLRLALLESGCALLKRAPWAQTQGSRRQAWQYLKPPAMETFSWTWIFDDLSFAHGVPRQNLQCIGGHVSAHTLMGAVNMAMQCSFSWYRGLVVIRFSSCCSLGRVSAALESGSTHHFFCAQHITRLGLRTRPGVECSGNCPFGGCLSFAEKTGASRASS